MNRRDLLRLAALAVPAALAGRARAQSARARRFIVFYYPDGVAGPSQEGMGSAWHPTGRDGAIQLTEQTAPLADFARDCVFFRGLSMGPTDAGSHPGGAQKLLTAVDHGQGASIDQVLAQSVGRDAPHRHVYLGAMANQNNASGDKHISYPAAGSSTPPEDDPRRAFARLFGAAPEPVADRGRQSVLDVVLADLRDLRGRLGAGERARLDLHVEAVREVERRATAVVPEACGAPESLGAVDDRLYEPERFPAILRAQTDLLVQAMACGLTKVGVIQASHHTSELVMSRFPGTPMHDPGFDMRSHQASHYGARHDPARAEFRAYVQQRAWWTQQFAHLLGELRARPEGDGTMLDHSVVLLCTEVCDGNTHLHDDMPFVLAGGAAVGVRTGRVIDVGGRRHGDLFASIGRALGAGFDRFGQDSQGPIPGLLA